MPEAGRRVFFGIEALGPWSSEIPKGRLIPLEGRHLTLAFLGFVKDERIGRLMSYIPKPPWTIGLIAEAKAPILLPPKRPRCLAWQIDVLESKDKFETYQKDLSEFLAKEKLLPENETARSFLPHITLTRSPFDVQEWIQSFKKQYITLSGMHLYESLGQSTYRPIHSWPVLLPFEELDHTADIAFLLRADSIRTLALHAFCALAAKCPSIINSPFAHQTITSLDELIEKLNQAIAHLDIHEGSPFKAVSYHGELVERENGIMEWEMIVDV